MLEESRNCDLTAVLEKRAFTNLLECAGKMWDLLSITVVRVANFVVSQVMLLLAVSICALKACRKSIPKRMGQVKWRITTQGHAICPTSAIRTCTVIKWVISKLFLFAACNFNCAPAGSVLITVYVRESNI